jgi:hypothetical protein
LEKDFALLNKNLRASEKCEEDGISDDKLSTDTPNVSEL